MTQLISIIRKDFIQIGKRNHKTFPRERCWQNTGTKNLQKWSLTVLLSLQGQVGETHWIKLPLDKSYQNPSNRCFTIEEIFPTQVPPGTQAPRSPFHLPAILSLQLPIRSQDSWRK